MGAAGPPCTGERNCPHLTRAAQQRVAGGMALVVTDARLCPFLTRIGPFSREVMVDGHHPLLAEHTSIRLWPSADIWGA
jgi:hypothetical protein